MCPDLEVGHTCSHFFDDSDPFVSQDPPGGNGRHIALWDVEIGSTNGRRGHTDNGIGRRLDERPRPRLQGSSSWTLIG